MCLTSDDGLGEDAKNEKNKNKNKNKKKVSLQPICLPGWNQLVSPAPMANAPTESRWFPGRVVGS